MKISSIRNIAFFLFSLTALLFSASCSKTPATSITIVIPTVSTTQVIVNLTSVSAQSGGVITYAGNGAISKNGVCYSSTNKTPTVADSKTTDSLYNPGNSVTTFNSILTGLTPGTTYYLRAYATNSAGSGYGGVLTFTTPTGSAGVTATVTTIAGNGSPGYLDGASAGALFNNPAGIAFDGKGNLFISDSFNELIRELSISSGNVTTIAGNQSAGLVNGAALSAEFYAPSGAVVDAQGNVYVSDQGNNIIRKITPAGVVSNYAGTGSAGYRNGAVDSAHLKSSTDSLAKFNSPQGLAIDAAGDIFVADRGNNVIREIFPTGRTKTIAGNKVKGFIDATDAAAFFNNPTGVAVDSKGNIWVSDQGNSALRKITSAGVVTTICGNPLQTTLLNYPSAVAVDATGNVFIADEAGRILEYTTSSVLNVLAGVANSPGLVDGIGAAARFNYPQAITVDASGNLYVADQYNNCIRKVVVSTTN